MSSRIEQIIDEIEEFVDSCKFQPLSSTKIVVNKEELEELLRELRMKTPDEIKRYQKIISNKDAILEDAQQKADAIIADAQAKADRIVSDSEVMQKALEQSNLLLEQTNAQAQDLIDRATEDSNNIRMSAISYTDELLSNLSAIMTNTLEEAATTFNEFSAVLSDYRDVVNENKQQLAPMEQQVAASANFDVQDEPVYEDAPDEGVSEEEGYEES